MIDFSQVRDWTIGQDKVVQAKLNGVVVWTTHNWVMGDVTDTSKFEWHDIDLPGDQWYGALKNSMIVLLKPELNGLGDQANRKIASIVMMTDSDNSHYTKVSVGNAPAGMDSLQSWINGSSVPRLDEQTPPSITGVTWVTSNSAKPTSGIITYNFLSNSRLTYDGNSLLLFISRTSLSGSSGNTRSKWLKGNYASQSNNCDYYSEHQSSTGYQISTIHLYKAPYMEINFVN